MHFGNENYPQYTYIKHKDQKSSLEQSEVIYMKELLKFCPTIPEITQMPGNFCREFSSEENKDLILAPLPQCEAKTSFAQLMDLWRTIRSTHKKTNPTEGELDEYPNLVRRFLKLLNKEFSWFKPLPNTFHRLSHNFHFMTIDANSLGVKSLEGLEKGNFTTQVYDAHHTFKGSRKKANQGVFKLLRLKSSRLLRNYRRKPTSRVQHCTRCNRVGHNAKNKLCLAGTNVGGDQVEGGVQGHQEEAGVHGDQGGAGAQEQQVIVDDHDVSVSDSLADLEDLLDGSGDDLY